MCAACLSTLSRQVAHALSPAPSGHPAVGNYLVSSETFNTWPVERVTIALTDAVPEALKFVPNTSYGSREHHRLAMDCATCLSHVGRLTIDALVAFDGDEVYVDPHVVPREFDQAAFRSYLARLSMDGGTMDSWGTAAFSFDAARVILSPDVLPPRFDEAAFNCLFGEVVSQDLLRRAFGSMKARTGPPPFVACDRFWPGDIDRVVVSANADRGQGMYVWFLCRLLDGRWASVDVSWVATLGSIFFDDARAYLSHDFSALARFGLDECTREDLELPDDRDGLAAWIEALKTLDPFELADRGLRRWSDSE